MLRSLWLLFIYVSFLGLSITAPFVATLGYVWVDTFQPQDVAYIILNQVPVAMILGILAFGAYLVMDRRSPPRLSLETSLQVAMAAWVTCTMLWAQAPDAAWTKWDWAFKTLVFSAFVPYVIRSRVQIEAFVQVYVLSLTANIIPFGVKTLISGGGYGVNLGLQSGNSGLSEGGLLSTLCLMMVPLAIFLSAHGQLIPRMKLLLVIYWTVAGLAIATAIGTYERSALLGLVVLGIYMWIRTKHKFAFGLAIGFLACIIIYATAGSYADRMATMGSYQSDTSAYVRILVWKWTLNFVSTHPLGGGFVAYIVNHIDVPGSDSEPPHTEFGRAFHSIYFEVLGEQGYPGIVMFLGIAVSMILKLNRLAKRAGGYLELQWVVSLANALQSGLAVFLASGAFVGIAFQPMFWYFISMGISLNAYMWRVEHEGIVVKTNWRISRSEPIGGLMVRPTLPK